MEKQKKSTNVFNKLLTNMSNTFMMFVLDIKGVNQIDPLGEIETMNELQVFNFENKRVRIVAENGELWFVAKDVAEALGYAVWSAIERLSFRAIFSTFSRNSDSTLMVNVVVFIIPPYSQLLTFTYIKYIINIDLSSDFY